uniref:Cysteine protease n=1 Tax=Auxenochlorella protothecoides TaxID=3075 RepID=A0A1D1ZNK5_AUXPR
MGDQDALSTYDQIRLTLSSSYYTLRRALKLNRLRDLLQQSALAPDAPIWIMGQEYAASPELGQEEQEEVLRELVCCFQSIIWMTYRSHFAPITVGDSHLRTDAGWGCTLRSGQMIMAQGLRRHLLGSDWRWPEESVASPPPGLASLLSLFHDLPQTSAPLSIHSLCEHGRACGVQAGRWLGPWVMAKSMEAVARTSRPLLDVGLTVAVLDEPGGAVPQLLISSHEDLWGGPFGGEAAAGPEPRPAGGGGPSSCAKRPGLIMLVPLVLGLGKLNPRYIPQLQAVLTMPQSIGIVGGRPGSSLYFVGTQQDLLLYLDPHEVQEAATGDEHWRSYCGTTLRTLPFTAMDPSLALGFYVGSKEEYLGLCSALEQLESRSGGAPLVCVTRARLSMEHESPLDEWEPDELTSEDEGAEVMHAEAGALHATEEGDAGTVPSAATVRDAGTPTREAGTALGGGALLDGVGLPSPQTDGASSPLASHGSRQLSTARSGWEML